jgi:2-dehydro-3-deoxy-D-arabinonate dehydratase
MHLIKFRANQENDRRPQVGLLQGDHVLPLGAGDRCLTDLLHASDLQARLDDGLSRSVSSPPLASVQVLAPLDGQEVWGAGVTYLRSKVARERESDSAASFYDLVYSADRPELFFKATASRVAGPGQAVRVRSDSSWTVPEPELALVLSPALALLGFTIGNDVSARDIEGQNPLYLPQAKVYDSCCALGPGITLASAMPPTESIGIRMEIARGGTIVFKGATAIARMARSFQALIDWLARDNVFPEGVILLTGTGIVPPDDFSLCPGDLVRIAIDGIGMLENSVAGAVLPRHADP